MERRKVLLERWGMLRDVTAVWRAAGLYRPTLDGSLQTLAAWAGCISPAWSIALEGDKMASGSGQHEFTGISARKNGKFMARIQVDGKNVNLGTHATLNEAAHAHDR